MKAPLMYSWMNPKLEVRKTSKYGKALFPSTTSGKKIYKKQPGIGNGVFAKKDLKRGETLFVMGGYILSIEDENKLTGIVSDKPIEVSDEFSIGPRKATDLPKMPQHYVNHSCEPNAGFKGQIFMVAMKPIKAGSEVVYDYGMIMQSNAHSNSYFQFECLCGTKSCRKIIGEDDWKKPILQKRYDGFFQFFIQEKINARGK